MIDCILSDFQLNYEMRVNIKIIQKKPLKNINAN